MKKNIIDLAFYATKTMFFFLFVGGLVGTLLTIPFVEMLTFRPFRFPRSVEYMLVGYIIIGIPVATFTGLLYGIGLALYPLRSWGRTILAIGCGIAPAALAIVFGGLGRSPWKPPDIGEIVLKAFCYMLFTGFSSLVTAWIHRKAELRFKFLRANGSPQEENG